MVRYENMYREILAHERGTAKRSDHWIFNAHAHALTHTYTWSDEVFFVCVAKKQSSIWIKFTHMVWILHTNRKWKYRLKGATHQFKYIMSVRLICRMSIISRISNIFVVGCWITRLLFNINLKIVYIFKSTVTSTNFIFSLIFFVL